MDAVNGANPNALTIYSATRIDLGILILRVASRRSNVHPWPAQAASLYIAGNYEFFEKNGFPGWTAIPVFILGLVCGGFLMLGLLSRWAAAALIPVTIDALMVPLAARMDVRPAGRRLGVHRISHRSTTQYCRARRWPVFAGHPHSARIGSISPADTGKGRTTLGRRTKDTLEYDREINAQSAVGCDS